MTITPYPYKTLFRYLKTNPFFCLSSQKNWIKHRIDLKKRNTIINKRINLTTKGRMYTKTPQAMPIISILQCTCNIRPYLSIKLEGTSKQFGMVLDSCCLITWHKKWHLSGITCQIVSIDKIDNNDLSVRLCRLFFYKIMCVFERITEVTTYF